LIHPVNFTSERQPKGALKPNAVNRLRESAIDANSKAKATQTLGISKKQCLYIDPETGETVDEKEVVMQVDEASFDSESDCDMPALLDLDSDSDSDFGEEIPNEEVCILFITFCISLIFNHRLLVYCCT